MLDAVVTCGRAGVTLVLGDFISKLKDRVLLMEKHEVVIFHFHLRHFLGHAVVLIQELFSLWVGKLLKILEFIRSYNLRSD